MLRRKPKNPYLHYNFNYLKIRAFMDNNFKGKEKNLKIENFNHRMIAIH